ncbi:MAG: hypothetical protein U1F71_01360 [Verrucomicrobiaceae bacterium]
MAAHYSSLFPAFPLEDQRRHRVQVFETEQRVIDSGQIILAEEPLAALNDLCDVIGGLKP